MIHLPGVRPRAGQPVQATERQPLVGRAARSYACAVVGMRYLVLFGWLIAVVLAALYLPSLAPARGAGDLVPRGSAALRAEADATRLFRVPMTAPVAVVQHSTRRLPLSVQKKAGRIALAVDRGTGVRIPGLAGALPIANTAGLFPGSREKSTTVITFLYFRPSASLAGMTAGAHRYARTYANAPRDHLVGVTGPYQRATSKAGSSAATCHG